MDATVLEVDSLGMEALDVDELEVEALEVDDLEVEALGEVSLVLSMCCLVLVFKRRILSSNFLHFFPSFLNKNNMFCVKECYWKSFTSQYF